MSKYAPLGEYLRRQGTEVVPMTFREIEAVIGSRLPAKAPRQRAWWSNNPGNNVMTKVWLQAGFKTEQVDIEGRKLVFRRIRAHAAGSEPSASRRAPDTNAGIRHSLFGRLKGLARVMPGTDLTAPADREWGKE